MTRNDLIKVAQLSGLTYRESRKVVSTFIDEMKEAIKRGEDIDLPFVVIHPVRNKRPVRLWRLNQIVVQNKKKYRFMLKQKNPWS